MWTAKLINFSIWWAYQKYLFTSLSIVFNRKCLRLIRRNNLATVAFPRLRYEELVSLSSRLYTVKNWAHPNNF